MTARPHVTLLQLSRQIAAAIAATPSLTDIWVVAETSDMRVSGGHCYLELIEKDNDSRTVARLRANIWATQWNAICHRFQTATGTPPASGMKILACATATYHPVFGISLNITDIDPSYTIGEAVRRRNEIVARLHAEGLTALNRSLRWPVPALRIAIVSAPGAAGYGDFINQLHNNPYRLRFTTTLFPAIMQGERTVPTVTHALDTIAARHTEFDCAVIIRGGGSTSDLAAFDDYNLGALVARFPIPVIVGIGHERDITVLDYTAAMRVKTPTAAAEWLIARGKAVLDALDNAATLIYRATTTRLTATREHLAHLAAALPAAVTLTLTRRHAQLDTAATAIRDAAQRTIADNRRHLDSLGALLGALSPAAVLSRGFSITLGPDGKTITTAAAVTAGTQLRTILANGQITSTATDIQPQSTTQP